MKSLVGVYIHVALSGNNEGYIANFHEHQDQDVCKNYSRFYHCMVQVGIMHTTRLQAAVLFNPSPSLLNIIFVGQGRLKVHSILHQYIMLVMCVQSDIDRVIDAHVDKPLTFSLTQTHIFIHTEKFNLKNNSIYELYI